ncbi:MAG: FKBP-type peptidyl-prolyl cis-trans isomerase N-terminal domain-containing protein [Limisphaerales bacterium]
MKTALRLIFAIGIAAASLETATAADNKPAVPPPPTPQKQEPAKLPPGFKDQKEQMSYSIGMSIGKNIKAGLIDLDTDVLTAALKDSVAGNTNALRMTEQEMMQGIRAYQAAANAKREEERVKEAEKNHKLGDAFLAENAKKEGIKTHTVTLPNGTKADMQYKVITEGTGPIPKSNDVVTVKYRGTTIDGKEFDNSSKRGPGGAKMMAGHATYPGWSAAWQMMKVGSKWELYLPAALARGDRPGPSGVEPGSTLIFEMELLSIEAPPAPRGVGPSPKPLTSDIIKVPSAAEIQNGAQPKIMKPEDVEKEMQNAKNASGTNSAKPSNGAAK